MARENAENCRSRQPYCRLTGNLREYSHKSYRLTARIIGQSHWPTVFAADSMGSFNLFCAGLRKTRLFCNRMRIGRSRSLIFAPIERAYATSY